MSSLDVRPRELDSDIADGVRPAPSAAERRPSLPRPSWWRWMAAWAASSPAGVLAYHLLTDPEQ